MAESSTAVYDRENPLFEKKVVVLYEDHTRSSERKQKPLVIRVLKGQRQSRSKSQQEKMIRIEITAVDEQDFAVVENASPVKKEQQDFFFLYVWSCSEEDFLLLKKQQQLIVDFQQFALNFIELLECCLHQQDHHPVAYRPPGQSPDSYSAILQINDWTGDDQHDFQCLFSIVEKNPFQHLTHLSLEFFPGNDLAIKSYLAERLAQTMSKNGTLQFQIQQRMKEVCRLEGSESSLQEEIQRVKSQLHDEMTTNQMNHSKEVTQLKEDHMNTLRAAEQSFLEKFEEEQLKNKQIIDNLEMKLRKKEEEAVKLTEWKYSNSLKIDQLTVEKKNWQERSKQNEKDLENLRTENQAKNQQLFDLEKVKNELQFKITALQQQVTDKEEVTGKTSDLLAAAHQHREEIEESLKLYKKNHQSLQSKLETSIDEINKGNKIIERIQNENKVLRAKIRMKSKVIKQQETVCEDRKNQVVDLSRSLKSSQEELENRNEKIENLKESLVAANEKLEESNKLLASNQQVISWLNKEINEAQMSQRQSKSAYSTAHTFNPMKKAEKRYGVSSTSTFSDSRQFTFPIKNIN